MKIPARVRAAALLCLVLLVDGCLGAAIIRKDTIDGIYMATPVDQRRGSGPDSKVVQEYGGQVGFICGLSWDVSAGDSGSGWGGYCGRM